MRPVLVGHLGGRGGGMAERIGRFGRCPGGSEESSSEAELSKMRRRFLARRRLLLLTGMNSSSAESSWRTSVAIGGASREELVD